MSKHSRSALASLVGAALSLAFLLIPLALHYVGGCALTDAAWCVYGLASWVAGVAGRALAASLLRS